MIFFYFGSVYMIFNDTTNMEMYRKTNIYSVVQNRKHIELIDR